MLSFQPKPLRAGHMQKRTEYGFVTNTHVAAQNVVGQVCGSIHCQVVGPLGVIEELSNVCQVHHCLSCVVSIRTYTLKRSPIPLQSKHSFWTCVPRNDPIDK